MRTSPNILKTLLPLMLMIVFMTSCKEDSKSSGTTESKVVEGLLNEVTGKNENINNKYAELHKELGTKTPLTNEQLIEAFPKRLKNLSIDKSEEHKLEPKIIGSQNVAGHFGNDTIRIEILDAAGQKAVGAIIPLKMLELNKITSESNNTIRYSKKERNGILTFGTDRDENTKADFQSELRFLYNNRFYVTVEGKAMDTNALWDAMGIENLQKFKNL
ncbi:hypothetical protein [Winogradskyella thalassocola]|uniref:Uncharacterized protein n=1 Tax=Winogradskyella thalassocola TaxID=262004 RepID=A0A1G7Y3V8_9FLAO|nr:hypothetical protein [Winogradskyella thalassocola]SDG91135.1 hypothetical protein SAMN04489796_101911 [Winogradskyella thalassocola]